MRRRAFLSRLVGLGAITSTAGCAPWSSSATAQRAPRLIAYFSGNTSDGAQTVLNALRPKLAELGHVEGRDYVFEQWVAENDATRLPQMAAEIVARQPALIVTEATLASLAAKHATPSIPIVFTQVTAPVGDGVVTSIAHPGGNITGVSTHTSELSSKRLEWLQEAVPGLKRIAMLWNGNFPSPLQGGRQDTIDGARALGIELESLPIHGTVELKAALATIGDRHVGAVLVLAGFSSVSRDRTLVPEAAAAVGLPQMFSDVLFARAGGLMAVAPNYDAIFRRAAEFIDRILRGTPVANIPVEFPTTDVRAINLKMADRLGLKIPQSLIRQATEIIS